MTALSPERIAAISPVLERSIAARAATDSSLPGLNRKFTRHLNGLTVSVPPVCRELSQPLHKRILALGEVSDALLCGAVAALRLRMPAE